MSAVREGRDSVTLSCRADSNPPPTYIWVRSNGDGEVGRGAQLRISPVSRADIDIYSCIASNSLGSSRPQPVDVNVHCKSPQSLLPSNSFLLVVPNVTIVPTPPAPAPLIEGRDALILDCDVEANPAPSISWYKDINLESGGVPRLQEIAQGPQYRVDTVSRHEAGLYTCIATNIIGESDRGDFAIDVHCEYKLWSQHPPSLPMCGGGGVVTAATRYHSPTTVLCVMII